MRRRALLVGLAILFFFSGTSALVYQVLWLKLLALIFGVTIHAGSTVLASYMAGLALGSLAAGATVNRLRRPLAWLGVTEMGIGACALISPMLLEGVEQLYVELHPLVAERPAWLTVLRFLGASLVLIVPTTLMGATLPLVVRSSLTRSADVGNHVGLLYASNTAGAVAGALLAGFVLVPFVGIARSFQFAALVNLLVGICALLLSRMSWEDEASGVEPSTSVDDPAVGTPAVSRATALLVLGVFAASGLASLALEIVWFRVLVLFLRPTAYAFTVMLAAVLAGIAIGSYLIAPLLRRRLNWLAILAGIELALGIVTLLSFAGLAHSHRLADVLSPWMADSPYVYLAPLVALSFLAIFPVTLLMGMAFPIGLRVWAAGADERAVDPARHVGTFYGLNVCGAIVGAIMGGFVLLPLLGSRNSLVMLALVSFVSGLLLLSRLPHGRLTTAAGFVAVLLFVVSLWWVPDPFRVLLERLHPGEKLLWREEGVQTTVSVQEGGAPSRRVRVLYLDGVHQANDSAPMESVHRNIGVLPMAVHPDPKTALVIGLGGGATAGAVAAFTNTSVDLVELSGAVARAAPWFGAINGDVLRRPNVQLRIDDGRNYLLVTPKRYDVITADIIQPQHAGSGNLYSADYFRLLLRALNRDGLVLQWIGSPSEFEYKLIMRTFMSVFHNTTLWSGGSLMIGTRRPLVLDRAVFEQRLEEPETRRALRRVALDDFDRLRAQFVAGPEELSAYVGEGPILTDDRPMVEYFLSLPRDRAVDLSGVRGEVDRYLR